VDEAVALSLDAMRSDLEASLGISVPRVRIVGDPQLQAGSWRLDVNGIPAGGGHAENIEDVARQTCQSIGRIGSQFVGIQETQTLLAAMEPAYADLVRESTKAAPLVRVAEVLRRLLDERVSVANLRSILEVVAEWGTREPNTAVLTEHVRVGLRRQICHALTGPDKVLPLVLIDAPLDDALRAAINATPAGPQLLLEPAALQRLSATLSDIVGSKSPASVLASPEIRRHLRSLLGRLGSDLPVLTHAELPQDFKLEVLGTLRHQQIMPAPAQGPREPPHLVAVGNRA
jgi:type III secretion protein V